MMTKTTDFYLGNRLPEGSEDSAPSVLVAPHALTTHGVILGMTGSGKTGLGAVLLEEAARQNVPSLIFDPKGDMGNLLLNFAGREASAYEPWVDGAEARRLGMSTEALAAQTASRWVEGTGRFGLDLRGDPTLALGGRFSILTPGSTRGRPVNLIGTLRCPPGAAQAEDLADEIDSIVSGLLGLLREPTDPLTSRPYVLLSALLRHAWDKGVDLTLPTLIEQVLQPPFRKLGVFQVDAFFPSEERTKLALQLNNLLASPAFAAWSQGEPLDVGELLANDDPHSTIIYLAHLSEEERHFVVSLILGKVITWVRRQPGTSALRALIYMDEVAGYAPPSAMPSTKRPLLTILKQARAQGVGMVLATQNPVDLDYKALSNTGTWWLGRMQTPQDRARLVQGLSGQTTDARALDAQIAGLETRQFVLHRAGKGEPFTFECRWALSFLRGPLTLAEVERLVEPCADTASDRAPPDTLAETPGLPLMPTVAAGVRCSYLREDAPWGQELGADFSGSLLFPALATRVTLRFDDTAAGIDVTQTWEAILFPLNETFDGTPREVDYDDRDFSPTPRAGDRYFEDSPRLDKLGLYRAFENRVKADLHAGEKLTLLRNDAVGLYSRPLETADAFRERCQRAAQDLAETQAAKLKDKYETKMRALQDKAQTAEQRAQQLELDKSGRAQQEWLAGAASVLGMFFGGRKSLSAITSAASRRNQTQRAKQRLEHAQEKLEDLNEKLMELEQELAEELTSLQQGCTGLAEQISTLEVGLEKNDIQVDEVRVVWIPQAF